VKAPRRRKAPEDLAASLLATDPCNDLLADLIVQGIGGNRRDAEDAEADGTGDREPGAGNASPKVAGEKSRHCLSVGCWKVYKTADRIRYVKCTACGRTDQTAV